SSSTSSIRSQCTRKLSYGPKSHQNDALSMRSRPLIRVPTLRLGTLALSKRRSHRIAEVRCSPLSTFMPYPPLRPNAGCHQKNLMNTMVLEEGIFDARQDGHKEDEQYGPQFHKVWVSSKPFERLSQPNHHAESE